MDCKFLATAAVLLLAAFAASAESTNHAAKVYDDFRRGRLGLNDAVAEYQAGITAGKNLPERVEAAERLTFLAGTSSSSQLRDAGQRNRITSDTIGLASTLLAGLDEDHKKSLAGLQLSLNLGFLMTGAKFTNPQLDFNAVTRRSLDCVERVLDFKASDIPKLVPADKVLADDEDLELEKEYAAGELKKLQAQAAANIVAMCQFRDDPGLIESSAQIKRLMAKYKDNPDIHASGRATLARYQEVLARNLASQSLNSISNR